MTQKTTRRASNKAGKVSPITQVQQIKKSDLAEHEKWLYNNPEALAAVKRGLADSAAGRVHVRRSYAEYADIEIED
jgi:hypothetical protein